MNFFMPESRKKLSHGRSNHRIVRLTGSPLLSLESLVERKTLDSTSTGCSAPMKETAAAAMIKAAGP